MKGKGERERCAQLNAEFQRKAMRDKKDFLSDQCKETEERLEISSRKLGTISCKDGHSKGQKRYNLTKAEDIKKRWQEYTELYKKRSS